MTHISHGATRFARRRKSLRLQAYDYSLPGYYFITICTHRRRLLFGAIRNDIISLNAQGRIAREELLRTPRRRNNAHIDAFGVMPDHVHAVFVIDGRGPQPVEGWAYVNTPLQSPSQTLGAMVRGYKAATASRINALRGTPGYSVWQRGFYDRVIRDERELERVRDYVTWNALNPPQPIARPVL